MWLIGMTIYGLIMNILFCSFFPPENYATYYFIYVMGYLLSYIIGFLLCNANMSALCSFIGYNMVTVPIGWIISLTLYALWDFEFEQIPVITVFYISIIVTTVLLVIGCVAPLKLLSKRFSLLIAVTATILLYIIALIIGIKWNLQILVYALLCNCYIAYNTCRAQIFPQTKCNAINSALDICVDVIFLILLAIKFDFELPDSLDN